MLLLSPRTLELLGWSAAAAGRLRHHALLHKGGHQQKPRVWRPHVSGEVRLVDLDQLVKVHQTALVAEGECGRHVCIGGAIAKADQPRPRETVAEATRS